MGIFTKTPEQEAKSAERWAKYEARKGRVADKKERQRVEYLAKSRASIRKLAEREYLRSRINLGVIKLDERQTLYLAMIFQELAVMNDRAAAAAGEDVEPDVEADGNLDAEVAKLSV